MDEIRWWPSTQANATAECQCRGTRETLKHKLFYWNPFSRGVSFNFTAKEVILSGESSLMCCKNRESRRSIVETVTSLQEVSALHNISPRTVGGNQTELESSGRPKPEQVCERYKRKAATGVWRFWDWVKVVLCSEGVAAGWTKGIFVRKVH